MSLHEILLTLLSALALAHAACYTTGEKWHDDKAYALGLADQACDGSGGRLAGRYLQHEGAREVCQNRAGRRVRLSVRRLPPELPMVPDYGDMILKPDDCGKMVKKEIDGCEHGGRSVQLENVYVFQADIDAGNCDKELPPKNLRRRRPSSNPLPFDTR
ncbi:hypothetical protein F5B20DRAFT_440349 [Whalleya microplaca]|nr:hypothetical protein F5B20DRAFT_440349 [Whalleya microplaca]